MGTTVRSEGRRGRMARYDISPFLMLASCSQPGSCAVPNDEEISLVLRILEEIGVPLIKQIERLFGPDSKWDNVSRNDFCRFDRTPSPLYILLTSWQVSPCTAIYLARTASFPQGNAKDCYDPLCARVRAS